jgi:hypothetical protein
VLKLLKNGASSAVNTFGCVVFRNEEKSKETVGKCTEIMCQIRKSSRSDFTSFDDREWSQNILRCTLWGF